MYGNNNEFEFNANYNPEYYTKELDEVIVTKKRAFSYKYSAEKTLNSFNKELLNHVYLGNFVIKLCQKHLIIQKKHLMKCTSL